MTPAAIVFDYYGTLAPRRTGRAATAARHEQAALLAVDPQAYEAELTATLDERFRGAGGDVEGQLRWVVARLGADPTAEQLSAAAEHRLAAIRAFSEPRPEAAAVLGELRERGVRIGVVSDCGPELPACFGELAIAPCVDVRVFSFVTGFRKPEPANYLACCADLGVAPPEVMYVGDGGSDELAGARRIGLRPVHLDVEDERSGVVVDAAGPWTGERIIGLGDVLDLL